MSNALAIAAVTATVRDLLLRGISDTASGAKVSTRPPDKAREGIHGPQLNLALYYCMVDAGLRDTDVPHRRREVDHPPLALSLHYVLTAYGEEEDDSAGHRLLGAGMRVLHDHPLLGPQELRAALPESDLTGVVEAIRIRNQPLTLDQMSMLWTTFQTPYRISTAYEIGVVLI